MRRFFIFFLLYKARKLPLKWATHCFSNPPTSNIPFNLSFLFFRLCAGNCEEHSGVPPVFVFIYKAPFTYTDLLTIGCNTMKNNTQQLAIAFLVLSLAINVSQAFQTKPFSDFTAIDRFLNTTQQWLTTHQARFHHDQTHLLISPPVLVAGVLSFIAASLSSAGGIGGGGLYIPILTIVAGADLKTASSLSAFMVTGGSVANVFSSFCSKKSKSGGKNLINFDIALLTQPCMLLGVSIGVICNLAFPEWVITILFAIFLAWSTLKTCKSGMLYWKLETQVLRSNGCEKLEDGTGDEHGAKALDEPLIDTQENRKLRLPLMKLGVLILVWFSFYLIYLLRGNRYGRVRIQAI